MNTLLSDETILSHAICEKEKNIGGSKTILRLAQIDSMMASELLETQVSLQAARLSNMHKTGSNYHRRLDQNHTKS